VSLRLAALPVFERPAETTTLLAEVPTERAAVPATSVSSLLPVASAISLSSLQLAAL
jgi:hypothetical protein